jgi:TonB family protein
MMSKLKSSNFIYWKTLIVLPVIMLALALSGSMASPQTGSGKDVTYTGKVLEAKSNTALPGAAVMIKGTTIGTVTDENGMFKISTSEGSSLVVSFVGYETNTFVPEKAELVIKMVKKVTQIEGTTVTPGGNKSTINPPPPPLPPPLPPPPPPDSTKANKPYSTTKDNEPLYTVVEESATFQDGDLTKFRDYVLKAVKYPAEAAKKGIQGKVILQFVVDQRGNVSEVKIIRGVSPLLDQAAADAIKSSPRWKPGIQGGKSVAQLFTMPVSFVLDGDKKKEEK